jgi:hypothetical protein
MSLSTSKLDVPKVGFLRKLSRTLSGATGSILFRHIVNSYSLLYSIVGSGVYVYFRDGTGPLHVQLITNHCIGYCSCGRPLPEKACSTHCKSVFFPTSDSPWKSVIRIFEHLCDATLAYVPVGTPGRGPSLPPSVGEVADMRSRRKSRSMTPIKLPGPLPSMYSLVEPVSSGRLISYLILRPRYPSRDYCPVVVDNSAVVCPLCSSAHRPRDDYDSVLMGMVRAKMSHYNSNGPDRPARCGASPQSEALDNAINVATSVAPPLLTPSMDFALESSFLDPVHGLGDVDPIHPGPIRQPSDLLDVD